MSETRISGLSNVLDHYSTNANRYQGNGQNPEQGSMNDIAVIYEPNAGTVQSYGLYSIQKSSAPIFKDNREIQGALGGLGFYVGPPDGSLKSDLMEKAIKNFQRVYGLEKTGKMNAETQKMLKKASTMRKNCILDSNFDKLAKHRDFTFDYKQKQDFLNTWTFLRVGMGLTREQAAGVCGNIHGESAFSSDNFENTEKNKKVHDRNYKYKVDDGKGYGLLQWTFSSRKKGLKDMAKTMNLDVSDINAQLAFFKKEMKSNYKNTWKKICNSDSYEDVTKLFLDEIEIPRVDNYKERCKYSATIFKYMKSH